MKARFTDEQIIAMIKEQESGKKTTDVCRRHGISSATFYKYKSKYGGMPKTIVSDNGAEFTSMAILKWVQGTPFTTATY